VPSLFTYYAIYAIIISTGIRPTTATAVDRKVKKMKALLNWNERLGMLPLAVLLLCTFIVTSAVNGAGFARADPFFAPNSLDEMKLGEFTTVEWFHQTGCVSTDPNRPNYIEFSSMYIGKRDAVLELRHVVNARWVTPSSDDLRISVGTAEQRQPYALLTGGANQMFDMTVWHVKPDEQFILLGRHIGSQHSTVLGAWSASERNECSPNAA
jgi:hypothetical protein